MNAAVRKVDVAFVRAQFSEPRVVRAFELAHSYGMWRAESVMCQWHLPRDKRILVVGCGTGRVCMGLYELGYRDVLGIDVSPDMVQRAKELASTVGIPLKYQAADACSLDRIPDGTFSGVLVPNSALTFVPGRERRDAALREIRRVLAPGGRLVLCAAERSPEHPEVNGDWQAERERWRRRRDPRLHDFGDVMGRFSGIPFYQHFASKRDVREQLRRTGFVVLSAACRFEFGSEAGMPRMMRQFSRFWAAERPRKG